MAKQQVGASPTELVLAHLQELIPVMFVAAVAKSAAALGRWGDRQRYHP
ncbi:hypothetical protein IQ265_14600 [Nodosilinea sp. LEGE 06152]|nr:hypothetical protein [Nodosilinea sp. LEGE 06152]MBE9158046.1 hypothetical protein [Nodosilinea sp. LEGE 06152]